MYSKIDVCVVCRVFAFKYILFFYRIQIIIYICTSEILKTVFFLVHNIHLYLCVQVENTKWILCSQKICDKCEYLRFLMIVNLLISLLLI